MYMYKYVYIYTHIVIYLQYDNYTSIKQLKFAKF